MFTFLEDILGITLPEDKEISIPDNLLYIYHIDKKAEYAKLQKMIEKEEAEEEVDEERLDELRSTKLADIAVCTTAEYDDSRRRISCYRTEAFYRCGDWHYFEFSTTYMIIHKSQIINDTFKELDLDQFIDEGVIEEQQKSVSFNKLYQYDKDKTMLFADHDTMSEPEGFVVLGDSCCFMKIYTQLLYVTNFPKKILSQNIYKTTFMTAKEMYTKSQRTRKSAKWHV